MAVNMSIRGTLFYENGRCFTVTVMNKRLGIPENFECLLEDVDLYNRVNFDRKKLYGHFRKGAEVTVCGKLVAKDVTYHQAFTGRTRKVQKLFVSPEHIFVRGDSRLYEI